MKRLIFKNSVTKTDFNLTIWSINVRKKIQYYFIFNNPVSQTFLPAQAEPAQRCSEGKTVYEWTVFAHGSNSMLYIEVLSERIQFASPNGSAAVMP